MYVLGINAYHGGASAAIIEDGRLIAAVEEERFTRQKDWAGFPAQSIQSCLDAAGISEQADKRPHELSGGQKQRVAVARALVTNPQMVLADEPTANLDHATAYRIIALMRRMRDERGTTFVFSTHDPKIMTEAEVTFELEDGRLQQAEHAVGQANA